MNETPNKNKDESTFYTERDMMYQLRNAKKMEGNTPVQWFVNSFFELSIWFDTDNTRIQSFQLTYDRYISPYTISRSEAHGFSHFIFDDGEIAGNFKKSPIVTMNILFYKNEIIQKFENESMQIDNNIREFILKKMSEFYRQ